MNKSLLLASLIAAAALALSACGKKEEVAPAMDAAASQVMEAASTVTEAASQVTEAASAVVDAAASAASM